MGSPPLDIVMSTYNGARHLPAQLRSIQRQTLPHWRLIVRDDGSQDETLAVLDRFAADDPRIRIVERDGSNIGPKQSFGRLLGRAGLHDLVLCADQDDIWHPEKLERLVDVVRRQRCGPDDPLLVCSDAVLVDEELGVVAPSFWRFTGFQAPSLEVRWLFAQNFVAGCSMLTTAGLRALALPMPPEAIMHDWWLALVAASRGRLVAIDEPLLLYRQHSGNFVGIGHRNLLAYLRTAMRLGSAAVLRAPIRFQAEAFHRRFGGRLNPADLLLRKIRSAWRKLCAARRARHAPRQADLRPFALEEDRPGSSLPSPSPLGGPPASA